MVTGDPDSSPKITGPGPTFPSFELGKGAVKIYLQNGILLPAPVALPVRDLCQEGQRMQEAIFFQEDVAA